jgi:acyl-ACP thioesterase
MNETYEMTYRPVSSECCPGGLWKISFAFSAMEEAMNRHCVLLGCSRGDILKKHGLVWMLARIGVSFYRLPREGETLTVKTWPGPPGRVTFPRYVEFRAGGELIGVSSSSWLAVDFEKRRLVLPGKCGISLPDTSRLTPPVPEPEKLTVSEEGETALRTVEGSDLDMNRHMNNAKYAAWIEDLQTEPIRELYIEYAQEAVLSQRVAMAHHESQNGFAVTGRDAENGTILFRAKGNY